MKRTRSFSLVFVLSIFFITLFNSQSLAAAPKITAVIENGPEVNKPKKCGVQKTNYTYDLTKVANDNCTLIFYSSTSMVGRDFIQIYENNSWVRITESKLAGNTNWQGRYEEIFDNVIKAKKPNYASDFLIPDIINIPSPSNPKAASAGQRYMQGDYCYSQTLDPLTLRLEFNTTKGDKYFSNEVKISFSNYDKVIAKGDRCVIKESGEIVGSNILILGQANTQETKPTPCTVTKTSTTTNSGGGTVTTKTIEPCGSTPTSQQGVSPKTSTSTLPPCSVSQIITLTDNIKIRDKSHQIRINTLANIYKQQRNYKLAVSSGDLQAAGNFQILIGRLSKNLQEASGLIGQIERDFKSVTGTCFADGVKLPVLSTLE